MGNDPLLRDRAGSEAARADRVSEWDALRDWLGSPPLLHKVDLGVLRERLAFVGRARSFLAALEADVVAEVSRREGDAAAEETLRRTQKRSRAGARKAVKTAAQLEWAPTVADKLAEGAITPEAASLILDAAGETPVDHGALLDAAESEPDDLFRKTLKEHVNERTSEEELEQRRARQRRRRRASISEQGDGMFHLFAQLDPLTGAQVQAALIAKSDQLFRSEDPKDRPTAPQRFADALAELVCTSDGDGVPAGVELLVLADYDQVHDAITNVRLADGTRLTEAEPSPWPVTPRSSRASSTSTPAMLCWGVPSARSRSGSASSSSPATAAASAAAPTTRSVKSTTSATGNMAAKPPWRTPAYSAGAATKYASTDTARRSPATPAAASPSDSQPASAATARKFRGRHRTADHRAEIGESMDATQVLCRLAQIERR